MILFPVWHHDFIHLPEHQYRYELQIAETLPMKNICRHLVISGRVQGVGYRAWFTQHAQAMALNGWVRNRHDGTVEAEICGPEESVEQLTAQCYEGPQLAKVTGIAVTEKPASGLAGFEIRGND